MPNPENLKPNSERTPEEIRENCRKAGIASGKTRRERATLRAVLQQMLDEKVAPGAELTKREAIAARCLKQLADNPKIADLKTLAEIVGEIEQKVEMHATTTQVIVNSEQTAADLQRVFDDAAPKE